MTEWGGGQGPEFLPLHGRKVLEDLSISMPKPLWKNYLPSLLFIAKRGISSQKPWNMSQSLRVEAGKV